MSREVQPTQDGGSQDLPAAKLSALLDVSRALSESLELSAVMQVAVDAAVRVMELDTGAIYLLTRETLFLGATTPPLPDGFPDMLRRTNAAEHPHVAECIAGRHTIRIEDAAAEELTDAEREVVDARGLRSILYVPLLAGEEEPVGSLILGSVGRTCSFSPADIDLASTLATSVALGVSNARLYEAQRSSNAELSRAYSQAQAVKQQLRALATQLTAAEVHERRRIADELHDRVCQPLAVLKMRLLEQGDGQSEDSTRDLALTLVDEALHQTRDIMLEASPPFIFDQGLKPALEWLGKRTVELGVRCEVFADPEIEGAEEEERLFVFQAARELLMNVVKHAGARYASLSVNCEEGHLRVRVTDDGRGFPTDILDETPTGERGFGLFSLRERAHYIGGSLDIASSLGIGTTALLQIPFADCESIRGGQSRHS